MYNVYCGSVIYKIRINNRYYYLRRPQNNSFANRLIKFVNYCAREKIHVTTGTCRPGELLCDKCWWRRGERYKFYHLTKNAQTYSEHLVHYFANTNHDIHGIVIPSMCQIELDLRKEFSDQYYNGMMDIGHEMWNNHLRGQTIRLTTKYFWNELFFYRSVKKYVNLNELIIKYGIIEYGSAQMTRKPIYHEELNIYNIEFDNDRYIDDRDIVFLINPELEW